MSMMMRARVRPKHKGSIAQVGAGLLVVLSVSGLTGSVDAKGFMEQNTARHGGDYKVVSLDKRGPESCLRMCEADTQCQAWSFVKPGVEGPDAKCRLKVTVPFRSESPCCVSGVSIGSSAPGRRTGY